MSDILEIIAASAAAPRAKQRAQAIFRRLGEAEAAVHGVDIEQVHFHEVGAVDAIVDIFGIALALEQLGVDHVFCSGFKTGRGTVRCAHGTIPVPVPATVKLLEGFPVTRLPIDSELTTPTGAAVLTALSEGTAEGLSAKLVRTGCGHGRREFAAMPNMVRAHLFEDNADSTCPRDTVIVLQSDTDDQSGEVLGNLMDRLLAAGALDVTFCPIQMKKNRPGTRLTVLCRPGDEDRLSTLVLSLSSTIGVRLWSAARRILPREEVTAETPWGTVRCKRVRRPNGIEIIPEFDAARELARSAGVPVRRILGAAGSWRED